MRRTILGLATILAVGTMGAATATAQPGAASGLSELRHEATLRGEVEPVHYRRRHYRRGGFGLFLPGLAIHIGPRYRYRYYEPYYYGSSYYYGGHSYYGHRHYRRHHVRRHHFRRWR